jgi:hypothetical protein
MVWFLFIIAIVAQQSQLQTFQDKVSRVFYLNDQTILHSLDSVYVFPKTLILSGVLDVQLDQNSLYLLTATDIYIYTTSLQKLPLPANTKPNDFDVPVLDFHPTQKDWLIYVSGSKACPNACHTTTYMTVDKGLNWKQVDTWSEKCVWARDVFFSNPALDNDAIYCMSYMYKNQDISQDKLRFQENSQNPLQFILIKNQGSSQTVMLDKGVQGFFVVSNVLVVASVFS